MATIIICKDCGEEKPLHGNDLCKRCHNRQWMREWYRSNKECGRQKCRNYYWSHAEERRAAALRRYHNLPLEERRARNLRGQKQRDQRRLEILKAGHCFYCGTRLPTNALAVDHFVPVSRGGLRSKANVLASCPSCNSSKCAKLPQEVLMQLPLHRRGEE